MLIILAVLGSASATTPCGESWPVDMVLPSTEDLPTNLSVAVAVQTVCVNDDIAGAGIEVVGPDGSSSLASGSRSSQLWVDVSLDGMLEPESEHTLRLMVPEDVGVHVITTTSSPLVRTPGPPDLDTVSVTARRDRRALASDRLTIRLQSPEDGLRYEALRGNEVVARSWEGAPVGDDYKTNWQATSDYDGELDVCVRVRTLDPLTAAPGELSEQVCATVEDGGGGCSSSGVPWIWGGVVGLLGLVGRRRVA